MNELRMRTVTDARQFQLTIWMIILSAAAVGVAIGFGFAFVACHLYDIVSKGLR